jgi:hypothetical protein
MILAKLLSKRQQTPDPLSHTSLWLNLSGKTTQVQMGMCVHQGGKQNGLIMVPRRSPKPLAAEQLKGPYVQNCATGHHHCAVFNGWLADGDDQSGPVKNRAGITARRRLGDAGTGRIEVDVFSGHIFPAGSSQLAASSYRRIMVLLLAVSC